METRLGVTRSSPTTTDWHRGAWLVFAAFVAHNLEEALTMGWFLRHAPRTGEPAAFASTTSDTFLVAVAIVTLVGLGLTLVGTTGRPAWWRPLLPASLAAVMLLNVVVPHVPAALSTRGYVPGVVTAVALIAPVHGWFLLRLRRAGTVTTGGLAVAFAAGAALLGAALPAIRTIARAVAE